MMRLRQYIQDVSGPEHPQFWHEYTLLQSKRRTAFSADVADEIIVFNNVVKARSVPMAVI